jgi:hypothetical protein
MARENWIPLKIEYADRPMAFSRLVVFLVLLCLVLFVIRRVLLNYVRKQLSYRFDDCSLDGGPSYFSIRNLRCRSPLGSCRLGNI